MGATDQPGDARLEVPVSYGTGAYLTARRGTLTLEGGEMTLRTRGGDVVVQGPIHGVSVAKGLDSLQLWIDSKRIRVRPGKSALKHVPVTAAGGVVAANTQRNQFNRFAAMFLAQAEALGAHIGKPDEQ